MPPASPENGITQAQVDANPDRYEVLQVGSGTGTDFKAEDQQVVQDRETGTIHPLVSDAPATPAPEAQNPQVAPEPPASPVKSEPSDNFTVLKNKDIQSIGTDPATFQYKAGGDAAGVTDRLKGVTDWHPERAGTSIVYEYADGRRVIADGHQRLGLAQRLAAEGKPIHQPALILKQTDGVTPQEARTVAALKNIAEGSGTAIDAAKVLRDTTQTPQQLGLPPNSSIVRDAMGMRSLSDVAFGMVVNGVSTEQHGGIVGRLVQDKAAQAGVLSLLNKLKPANAFQAESIARQAAAETVTEHQDSLFGPEAVAQNLYLERAKVLDAAVKQAKDDRKTFGRLNDHADRIQAAGNVLDQAANAGQVASATALEHYLSTQANTKGPISDALSQAARNLHAGKRIGEVTSQFLRAVQGQLGAGRGNGKASGGTGAADERPSSAEPQADIKPPIEQTAAGTQTVIRGAEQDAQASAAARKPQQQALIDAKAQQSKMGTTAPQDGGGPLFAPPEADLFSAPKVEAWERLRDKAAEAIKPYEHEQDYHGTPHPDGPMLIKLLRALADAPGMKARSKIADAWVLEQGKDTGVEHVVIFDRAGLPVFVGKGHVSGVAPSNAVGRMAIADRVGYVTHNHPSSTGFSGSDVAMMVQGFNTLVAIGHNGERHEGSTTGALSRGRLPSDRTGMVDTRAMAEPLRDALAAQREFLNRLVSIGRISSDQAIVADRPAFALVLEKMGLINYIGGTVADIEAAGVNFNDLYAHVAKHTADGLRRAGFPVAQSGSAGSVGASEGRSGSARGGAAAKPAENGNDSGRIRVKTAAQRAIDRLYGKESSDVSSTGTGLEPDRGNAGSADAVGAENVSASAGSDGRGNAGRNGQDQGANGQPDRSGGVSGGDAASLGGAGDSGVQSGVRTAAKSATSGKRGRRDGAGGGGLSTGSEGKSNAASDVAGSTGLTPEAAADLAKRLNDLLGDEQAAEVQTKTNTPTFMKWFGDSYVVNPDGSPMAVFHGTNASIDQFKLGASKGLDAVASNAFYFSQNDSLRSGIKEVTKNEVSAYLSIRNPVDLTGPEGFMALEDAYNKERNIYSRIATSGEGKGMRAYRDAQDAIAAYPFVLYRPGEAAWAWGFKPDLTLWQNLDRSGNANEHLNRIVDWARESGFDGLKMLDYGKAIGGGKESSSHIGIVWAALAPTQIKSVNNRGTWDANSPFMLHEDAYDVDPRKYDAVKAMLDAALGDTDLSHLDPVEQFMAVMGPLQLSLSRKAMESLVPILEKYLAERAVGRVEPQANKPAPIEADDRAARQAKADRVRVIQADAANIAATLPLLLPVQHDDVLKIETRFAKPDGHGMMITNGTGTGKTYTGMGQIKRFVQAGKKNVLIVAPSDAVIAGWVRTAADMGVEVTQLADTKDAGKGVTITTYANLLANNALASRAWDLIVPDEAQNLSSNQEGAATGALQNLRAISHRPGDLQHKSRMLHAEDWARFDALKSGEAKTVVYTRLKAREDAEVAKFATQPRAKVLFLSATPFAYDKSIDYAEGYLFNYPADGRIGNSNQGGRERFMVENFGYRIRYHKLTKPESAVDSAVMEREFHEKLRRDGVLSGRALQVDVDYDRRFVLTHDAVGTKIDAILQHISEGARSTDKALADGFQTIDKAVSRNFSYHKRMQLLEAIKARAAIPDIQKHLAMGRKIVVFHDFNIGGGTNPFLGLNIAEDDNALKAMADLMTAHPDLEKMDFSGYAAPMVAIPAAFGKQAAVFNGTAAKKDRAKALIDFNTDGSGVDVLVVQSDAGGAGISMHDLTGNHQRVLINLGMPVKPTSALQEEGRILRVGTKTNAPFRYYTIGTNWERTAFARTIAERSGTAENLALGNQARAIRDGFINAYMDAAELEPSAEDGTGGKALDHVDNTLTPFQIAKTHYFSRMKVTGRRDQREGVDFYPTPEPLGYKMVEWAGIRPNERVLEPSAGDGAIARYAPENAALTMVEPSSDLASRAQLRAPWGKVEQNTFENYHLVNKHHVIVMNPPFGVGGKTAMEHLAKAARHLRDGGRIVALIPTGPSADKRFSDFIDSPEAKELVYAATVSLPPIAFERAGTSVQTRIVVLDKVVDQIAHDQHVLDILHSSNDRLNFTGATSINAFFDRLEQYGLPPRPAPKMDAVTELEQEGQDSADPVKKPGKPMAATVGAFADATFTSQKGKVFPATRHEAQVEDAVYQAMIATAKSHGGFYIRGKKGEGPGFAFKTEAAKKQFLEDMAKPTVGFEEASGVQEQRQAPSPIDHAEAVRQARAGWSDAVQMLPTLRAELDRLDLKRVDLKIDPTAEYQGMIWETPQGALQIVIGNSLDPQATVYHEVIHALRTMNLFTDQEWAALEHAAVKGGWLDKHDIPARYPDLMPHEQIEEAIAEEFSRALDSKTAPTGSTVIRAFNKIARALKAFRNVFRGAGWNTAEDLFGKVMAGEIAARAKSQGKQDAPRFQRPIRPLSAQGRAHLNSGMQGSIFIPDRRVWETLTDASKSIWQRLKDQPGAARDAVDRARINLQDKFLPFKRAQQAIELSTGKILSDSQNAWEVQKTFSGKTAKHFDDIDHTATHPIVKIIAASKGRMTADSVGQWLYARHAPERNAHIASINLQMPDGGSGMTDAEAAAIVGQVAASPDAAAYAKIGSIIDALRERTLALRVDAGLIKHTEADQWRKQYKFYVPLKGFDETDHSEATLDVAGIGRRLNIRGGETKRALGRGSDAFNPLQGALTQAQEASIRAEKNRVGNAIYDLAKGFPSDALWSIKKPVQKRYFNRTTGLVETRVEDPISLILDPNEMAIKVDGEEVRILFKDLRLARAAGTMGADQMGSFGHFMSSVMMFWRATRTSLAIPFVIKNAIRDAIFAQVNLLAIAGPQHSWRLHAAAIKNWPAAFAGIYRGQAGHIDTKWSKFYDEFQNSGAKVSFFRMENPTRAKVDLERQIRLASGSLAARAAKTLTSPRALVSARDNPFLAFTERVNLAVENATRLAVFVAARQEGVSEQKSAIMARDLTLDFNTKGEWGGVLNVLYGFFNAGMQGAYAVINAMGSRRVRRVAMALIAAGFFGDMINANLSHMDPDGVLAYDKIPEYQNQMSVQAMLGQDASHALAVPMPYGFSVFTYLGQEAGKVQRGVTTPAQAVSNMMGAALQSYAPISGGDIYSTITPTLGDLPLDLARNKNWLLRPIKPPDFPGSMKPESEKYFGSVSSASVSIAQGLNSATGGTSGMAGAVDISPEYLDYMAAFVTGSAGSFWGSSVDLATKALTGDTKDVEVGDIPIVKDFVHGPNRFTDSSRYFQFRDNIEHAVYAVKMAAKTGDVLPDAVLKWAALGPALKEAEKRRSNGEDIYLLFNKKVTQTIGQIAG